MDHASTKPLIIATPPNRLGLLALLNSVLSLLNPIGDAAADRERRSRITLRKVDDDSKIHIA
ncbi:hypothetical protein WG66_004217 [Moniliophthora roreri]|nr:hypothetical protein WG66_004217 [Moniliophthora roreri]